MIQEIRDHPWQRSRIMVSEPATAARRTRVLTGKPQGSVPGPLAKGQRRPCRLTVGAQRRPAPLFAQALDDA